MTFVGFLLAVGLVLAERGATSAVSVVVPETAGATVRYAAEELCAHVRTMTGVSLPTVSAADGAAVRFREVTDPKLGTDGFRLRTEGGDLIVEGGRRGVLYGVYELLETYGGCGWYSSRTTVVPSRDRFEVPADLNVTQKPAFVARELLWYDTRNTVFGARLRLNANFHMPTERQGGNEYRFGGGLGNCHTFAKLVPVDEYYDAHPEYFSEAGGRRLKDHTQLCLTNPDVLRIVTEKVIAAIARDPGAKYFGVSQNDWQGFCTCAKCRAIDDTEGSHAGTMIRFVNAVADEVAKTHPDKIIETLAYQYTRKPPKKTRPRDNVMVCLCSIECDFSTPIATGTYAQNVSFRDDIRAWAKLTDKLYVWDYTTNFGRYLQPFPNIDVLLPNLKFFRDNGVVSLLEQGCYQGAHAEFAELKAWLLAKGMWNPDQPAEPLIARFLDAYYGKAAPFVKTYLEELLTLQRKRAAKGGNLNIFEPTGASVCDAAFLAKAAALWRQAEKAVAGDAEKAYNVRMSALPTMYQLFKTQCREFSVARKTAATVGGGIRPVALAKWVKATLAKSERPIIVSETQGATEKFKARLDKFIASATDDAASDRLVIPMEKLRVSKFAEVEGATTGKAFAPPNSGYDWYVPLQMGDLAYDADTEYVIRVRVKVMRTANGPDGEAFWAGLYDNAAATGLRSINPKVSDCGEGWKWYDVGTLKLADPQCLWVGSGRFDRKTLGCNPCVDAVYFDAVEIVRKDVASKKERKTK